MHKTVKRFWQAHHALPGGIQQIARKQFAILKADPNHPSIRFKKIPVVDGAELWSARVNLQYRALVYRDSARWTRFWIGEHGIRLADPLTEKIYPTSMRPRSDDRGNWPREAGAAHHHAHFNEAAIR